jgi:hypothetical protein
LSGTTYVQKIQNERICFQRTKIISYNSIILFIIANYFTLQRSTELDEWGNEQLERMVQGGNGKAKAFFRQHGVAVSYMPYLIFCSAL